MFLDGVLAALLAASAIAHVFHFYSSRRAIQAAMHRESRALDAMHAAELRSAQQIDAMLERIATAPRLDLTAGRPSPPVEEEKLYISDLPYDDERWNEFTGEADQEEKPE